MAEADFQGLFKPSPELDRFLRQLTGQVVEEASRQVDEQLVAIVFDAFTWLLEQSDKDPLLLYKQPGELTRLYIASLRVEYEDSSLRDGTEAWNPRCC